ncbi:MAG: TonB-dependent receptor domain-containing protein, partial [Vicinamibacteria bacterium]
SVTQTDFHVPGTPTLAYPSVTLGQNTNTPQKTFQRKWQFRDTFSYSLDTHDLKFGGELLRGDPFGFDLPFSSNGFFSYANDGDPTNMADFFTQFDIIPPAEIPYSAVGFFAQDDWRVSDALTLNIGLRYDVEYGTLSNIPFGPNGETLKTHPNSPYVGSGDLEDDKNNWGPRIGFAWDVGARGTTVVRGGYGIFFDKIIANATLFNFIDFYQVRGVSISNPSFAPENLPSFDELFQEAGFLLPFDNIVAPGFQFPKTEQITIGVSHQISPSMAFDVDYIRSKGSERGKRFDLNERNIPGLNSSRIFFPENQGRMRVIDSVGVDTYDGLQMSWRKRMSNNIQFTVNYTLADLRGNSESGFGSEAECYECIGDSRDIGPYTNDTRHNLITGGIFQLPADFMFSVLGQFESGRALTASSSQDLNGNGRRPNLDFTEGPNGEPPGRGNFRGSPTYTVDLRLAKAFRFDGDKNFQVMFETYNLFNRVNEGTNHEQTFESANFGGWTQGLETNQLQIQLGVRFEF